MAKKEKNHKPIKKPFPPAVVEVIQPLFDRLGDERLLAGCEKCYTQNANESLHHVVWSMAPKEQYNSPQEISTAISLGVLQYNRGFKRTYADLLEGVQVVVNEEMVNTWQEIDNERIRQNNYRAASQVQLKRKKKRSKKLKAQDAFVHDEGVQCQSQSFHGGAATNGAIPKATTKRKSTASSGNSKRSKKGT